MAALPLDRVIDLAIGESGAGFPVDRSAGSSPTAFGIAIFEVAARRRYEGNVPPLLRSLRDALRGCAAVYTNNPWGEYGRAEHVQVHRAVAAPADDLGFAVWFSNHVGAASWRPAGRLALLTPWSERLLERPDRARATELARIYRRHGAWTWTGRGTARARGILPGNRAARRRRSPVLADALAPGMPSPPLRRAAAGGMARRPPGRGAQAWPHGNDRS